MNRRFLNIRNNIKLLLISVFMLSLLIGRGEVSAVNYDSLYHYGNQIRFSNPELAEEKYRACLTYYKAEGHSEKIIDIKLKLIELYSGGGYYLKAYDEAWSLLPLVSDGKHEEASIDLGLKLGSLFIIFEQFERANQYLEDALKKANELEDAQDQGYWLSKGLAIKAWANTKGKGEFETSQALLVKAMHENSKTENGSDIYLQMQMAELLLMHDHINEAEQLLKAIEDEYKEKSNSAHSLLFDHMGQLIMIKGDYPLAINYFKKCIKAIDKYKNHLDNKVEVLDSIASCYYYLGNSDSAYYYTRLTMKISNELFGRRNSVNKALFEIKDRYQEELKEHRLVFLEQKNKVLILKTLLYVSLLILVIIALVIRSKLRSRKITVLSKVRIEEKKRQKVEIEYKNKELAASALKLIERDVLLDDVRKGLQSLQIHENEREKMKRILSSIHANKAQNWDEFEMYFTQVNQGFYRILQNKFPDLSSTDLKMCGLIKLGLSSKEIAGLMGIGTDSVNTSRSRIRKKINLSREDNLVDYLQKIE